MISTTNREKETMMAKNPRIDLLLGIIDRAYDKMSWHGTNLRGSIRGVTTEVAAWRPGPGRHNIWEIVVHAAYWKYTVRRRLLGEKRGSFPLRGSNWFVRPEGRDDRGWKADIALLEAEHRKMIEAISRLQASELHHIPKGSRRSNLFVISGIAAHDLYHAGQIQLLKRLH